MAGEAKVGTILIGMRAGVGGLSKDLKGARAEVAGFASGALGDLKKLAVAGLGVLGVGVSVGWLKGLHDESSAAIDSTAKLADRIGATTEGLVGLQHAAGLAGADAGVLVASLEKLGVNLAKGAGGSKELSAAFARLGLDAARVASMDRVEAFKLIADRLGAIENPAERAALATQLFGRAGAQLGNLLAQGSEGIAAAQAEAERLGLTFSRVDAAQVEAANDAWAKMQAVITGVGNQLTIAVAPYLQAAADRFVAFATEGTGAAGLVRGALGHLGKVVGLVADAGHVLGIAFRAAFTGGAVAAAALVTGLAAIGQGIQAVVNLLPGVDVQFADSFSQYAADVRAFASGALGDLRDAIDAPMPSEGINRFIDGLHASAARAAEAARGMRGAFAGVDAEASKLGESVDKLTEKLRDQVATFGLSSTEAEIFRLAQQGATEAELAEARALAGQLAGMEASRDARKRMADDAKALYESTRTPLERMEAEVAKARDLLAAGLIDQSTFDRAVAAARAEAGKGGDRARAAGALEAGSKEARSAVLAFRRGAGREPIDDVAKNTSEQVRRQDTTNDLLGRLADAFARTFGAGHDLIPAA